jgi:hypothetical protein
MFREGDIVEIPLPGGRAAIGWILHLSRHFKDAVGFIVFGIKGELRHDYVEESRSLKVLGPLYTNVDAIKHYGWQTIQHQPISEEKRLLTKRTVGGDVYVADDYIGPVEQHGGDNLPAMLLYGMVAVYKEIEAAFPVRK